MLRFLLLAIALCASCVAFCQLSKGEGRSIEISDRKFSCYLPKYFEIQEEPPGVIHKASGAFVIAVKVPSDKRVSVHDGLQRSFFEDPRYEIVSLKEEVEMNRKHHGSNNRSYWMHYKLQGFDFERYTTLTAHGGEQYLIIGNYPVKLKNQVQQEIKEIMESFTIR